MEWIGKRIRKQRRRLGLTLDELAERVKVSKTYLSLLETGRMQKPPSDEKLIILGAALELPTEILLIHARLLRTPPEVRAMLEQLMTGHRVDTPVKRAVRVMLREVMI